MRRQRPPDLRHPGDDRAEHQQRHGQQLRRKQHFSQMGQDYLKVAEREA